MSAKENTATIQRFVDEFVNHNNVSVMDDLVSRDFMFHDTSGKAYKGTDDFKKQASMFSSAYPDTRAKLEDWVVDDVKGSIRITFSGTQTGNLMGIAPTGKKASMPAIIFFHFKDGKITEMWQMYDMMNVMQQLGVAPQMGQAVR